MLDGIMISAGILFGIVARYFYVHSYDESCCGGEIDWCNLILSILFDCASVTLMVGSLGNYRKSAAIPLALAMGSVKCDIGI